MNLYSRWRDVLRAGLLPEPSASATGRSRTAIGYVALVAALWVLTFLRDSSMWHTLWAEDGSVFLLPAAEHPCPDILSPYAGYMQFVPRLISCATAQAGPAQWPHLFALASSLVAALILASVVRAVRAVLPSLAMRLGLVAALALAPITGREVLDVTTNLQWLMVPGCFVWLIWREDRWGNLVPAVAVFAAVTSSALALLLAPLAFLRLWIAPRWVDRIVPLAWCLGAVVELGVISSTSRAPVATHPGPGDLGVAYLARVVTVGAVGRTWGRRLLHWQEVGAVAFAAALLVALALLAWRDRSSRVLVVSSMLGSVGYTGAILWRAWSPLLGYSRAVPDLALGSRYFVIPIFFLTVVAVVAARQAWLLRTRVAVARFGVRAVAVVVGAAFVLGTATDFREGESARRGVPRWSHELAAARNACAHGASTARVRTAPLGWSDEVPCLLVR